MARKLLASLNVYLDDDSVSDPNFTQSELRAEFGSNQYSLTLRPNMDTKRSPRLGKETESIFAHELGHFMQNTLQTEKAKQGNMNFFVGNWSREDELANEREAWEFALQIKPDLNRELMTQAIETYQGKRGSVE